MQEAIILAGGLGTRLRSTISDLPKCMAPVNGKPFIDFVIEYFQQQGIKHFIFSLGYLSEILIEHLDKHIHIDKTYVIEEFPLGTGGAIKKCCYHSFNPNVLIANGDTIFKVSVEELLQHHNSYHADCTLSLKRMENFDRYGTVTLNNDNTIASFKEKQFYEKGLINGGVYILNREKFVQENLPEKFSFETDYLEKFFNHRKIYGLVQDGYFIDIGIPEDFLKAQNELKNI